MLRSCCRSFIRHIIYKRFILYIFPFSAIIIFYEIFWEKYLPFAFLLVNFQSSRPIAGLFCLLMTEAREATALEMPDRENAFVLKSEWSGAEFVVEAPSAEERKSWLAILQTFMKCQGERDRDGRTGSALLRPSKAVFQAPYSIQP